MYTMPRRKRPSNFLYSSPPPPLGSPSASGAASAAARGGCRGSPAAAAPLRLPQRLSAETPGAGGKGWPKNSQLGRQSKLGNRDLLHYTPEHCLVNGGVLCFGGKKHVSNGQIVSFKEPW